MVATAFCIELLYLIAANCFLNLRLLPRMFADTNTVKGRLDSGWSIFPGHVHVHNLQITVQDHNVEASIQIARAEVDISLHELAKKVFHATKLRGSGLVFRFRHRVMPASENLASVRAVPPIPGFEDPPVFEAWVPPPPISDSEYDLWTVHLEDVDIGADEVWVQQFRYVGKARAVGAFRLKPARSLWVGPASLDLARGRIVVADRDAIGSFGGRIECTVSPFDVRVPQGLAVLRYFSAMTHLSGDVVAGDLIDLFLDPRSRAHIEQEGATVKIDATLARGVLSTSSRAAIEGESLTVHFGALLSDFPGPWSLIAAGDPQGDAGRLDVSMSRAILHRDGFQTSPTEVRDANVTLASDTLDTTIAWKLRRAELRLGDLVAPDLRIFDDARLGSVRFRGGAGVAQGRVVYSRGMFSGDGVAELRRAIADVGDTKLRGSVWMSAKTTGFDAHDDTGTFDASFQGGDFNASDVSGEAECPWFYAETAKGEAHFDFLPHGGTSGTASASFGRTGLVWGDFRLSGDAEVRATEAPPNAASESHVEARLDALRVLARSGPGAPKRWDARVRKVSVEASLERKDGRFDGPIDVTADRLEATIGAVSMRTDLRAHVRSAKIDTMERSGTVAGVVNLTNATLWNRRRRVEGWWAEIGVSPTRVAIRESLELDGTASVHMKDGLPGLLALGEADQIPGFLSSVLPTNGLAGTVRAVRHCQLTDLTMSQFEGGPLSASGRIQSSPGETRGALLVRLSGLGLVSAGITFGGSESGVWLFRGDDWLDGQMAALDQKAISNQVLPCPAPAKTECDEAAGR